MNHRILIFGLLGTSLIFYSCASKYRAPESVESKMSRFQANGTNPNIVPKLPVMETLIDDRSRSIASLGTIKINETDENKMEEVDPSDNFSNKKLYFMALYSQYREMAKFCSISFDELKICPNFHNIVIDNQTDKLSFEKKHIPNHWGNGAQNVLYPELHLPLPKNSTSIHKNAESVEQALTWHVQKTRNELEELCEKGASENYYTYENLLTFIKMKKSLDSSSDNLSSLMKTTLINNMLIIDSLNDGNGRSPASAVNNPYQTDIIKKFRAPWLKNYIGNLKKKRSEQ